MKKVLAALCAAVMVLASTVTAMASQSISTSKVEMGSVETLKEAMSSTDADMKVVSKTVANEAQKEAVKLLETGKKAKILALADVSFKDGRTSGTLKFAVDGVFSTDSVATIRILHKGANGWETITPDKVEAGYVTATFSSLSPVAIVKIIPEAGKFGVGFSTLALVAAAGLAGAVVCGKKKSN